jgi:release factor glutamine methyltransferase
VTAWSRTRFRGYGWRVTSGDQKASIVARLRAAGCVFAEDEAEVLLATSTDADELDAMVASRASGLPLEHVVGWALFCGLRIVVHPGVFVPRRRTEALVRAAVGVTAPGATVIDLCCGSGAIAAAIATQVPGVRLWASDIDPAAVHCARVNLAAFDAQVQTGDVDDAIPHELHRRVGVLVANVPYVPSLETEYLPAEARLHEPRAALDGGHDGLDVLRRVVVSSTKWLCPGGWFLTECTPDQAETAADVLRGVGLVATVVVDDDLDVAIVAGQRGVADDDDLTR